MRQIKSALLYFITLEEPDSGKVLILFCLYREVIEYPPKVIYWYTKCERLIDSSEIIRGWSCIASIEEIATIVEKIKNKNYSIDGTFIEFPEDLIPIEISSDESNAIYKFDKLNFLSSNYRARNFTINDWTNQIGKHIVDKLLDEKIADSICGYKSNLQIQPGCINPHGMITKGGLYRYLSDGIVYREEPLGIDIRFRGTGLTEKKKLEGYAGTVFGLKNGNYQLEFFNEHGKLIDSVTFESKQSWGQWFIHLGDRATSKGAYKLTEVESKNVIGGERFYILMNINFNVNLISTEVQDLYKRVLYISSRDSEIKPPERLLWQNSFRNHHDEVADRLGLILASLGQNILIHDPYGLGKLEINNSTKEIVLNESLKCFINSIIVAMTKTNIFELKLLIDKKRIGIKQDELEKVIENYKIIFEKLLPLGLKKASLGFAKSTFHDRYFFSFDKHLLFKSSKSMSGLLETDELEIELDNSSMVQTKISQIIARWDNSEKVNLVG